MYNREKTQNKILELQRAFIDAFNTAADISRNAAIKNLRPGEKAPAAGRVYGEDRRNAFAEKAAALRADGQKIIDDARADVLAEMSAAPTAEAVNSVNMLKLRDRVTGAEVSALINEYGQNYQTYQVIKDIAKKSEIRLEEHPLDTALADLDRMARTVSQMDLAGAERGRAADSAFIAFQEAFFS